MAKRSDDTVAADADLRQSLSVVRDTLSQAMNTIRASVHNLHEESVDLTTRSMLSQGFHFCPDSSRLRLTANQRRRSHTASSPSSQKG